MPTKEGEPSFAPGDCPVFDGDRRVELDADCCTRPTCVQRDFNRNALLLFEKMTASYAAINLLRWNTAQVWTCDDEGHSVDCPNPECVFGGQQIERVDTAMAVMEGAIKHVFTSMTAVALDLRAEWEAFTIIERAAVNLDYVAEAVATGAMTSEIAVASTKRSLETLQGEAVENDAMALLDLFSPVRS